MYHSYRIRLPTEKELEMTVSKEVKKKRYYESTLLSTYKVWLGALWNGLYLNKNGVLICTKMFGCWPWSLLSWLEKYFSIFGC